MSKYQVYVPGWIGYYETVEADSAEEAIEQACPSDICAQCSGWGRDYSLEINDDWDWENAEAEEVDS